MCVCVCVCVCVCMCVCVSVTLACNHFFSEVSNQVDIILCICVANVEVMMPIDFQGSQMSYEVNRGHNLKIL